MRDQLLQLLRQLSSEQMFWSERGESIFSYEDPMSMSGEEVYYHVGEDCVLRDPYSELHEMSFEEAFQAFSS
jgi:hypothetical protein